MIIATRQKVLSKKGNIQDNAEMFNHELWLKFLPFAKLLP